MMEVLEAVGLAGWVPELSGGQRCRLLLARVLLLDEPVEHLDATSAAEMLDLLSRDELPGRRARRVRHPR